MEDKKYHADKPAPKYELTGPIILRMYSVPYGCWMYDIGHAWFTEDFVPKALAHYNKLNAQMSN